MLLGRWRGIVLLASLALVARAVPAPADDMESATLRVGRAERLLVLAPHPDDETLGTGGLVQRVLANGGTVKIVLLTAGDGYREGVASETGRPQPRPSEYVEYGERRFHEAQAAARELGGDRIRVQLLGYPDRGLEALLNAHWLRAHAARSATTGASDPPYRQALDPNIPYAGASLEGQLVHLLREMRPTIVAFPDPVDKHPDHHAAGLFTLLAIDEWSRETRGMPPRLLAYLVHWPAWPPGWEGNVAAAATHEALQLPATLPPRRLATATFRLTPAEQVHKGAALARHASQEEVMGSFLSAFLRETEPFTILTLTDAHRITQSIERLREAEERGKSMARRG